MGIFNMAYQGWDHESLRPTYPSELPMLLTSQSILPCQKSLRTMYFLRYRADYKQGLAPWGKGSSFSLFFFIVLPLFRLPPRPFHLALCPMNDSRIHLSGPKEEARLTRLHREVGEGLREQVRDVEHRRNDLPQGRPWQSFNHCQMVFSPENTSIQVILNRLTRLFSGSQEYIPVYIHVYICTHSHTHIVCNNN